MDGIISLPDLFEKLLGDEIAATLDDDGEGIAATVARTAFHGMNALHAARSLHVYRYLLEVANMDVNKPDTTPGRKTPLERAIACGDLPSVRYLIDHGADIHHEREGSITFLHSAAKKGRTEIVKLLLSRGAHVDGKSDHGTPLHFAAIKGYESTVKILLEHQADPNKVMPSSQATPLSAALFATSLPCVKLLIQAGADVNATNNPLARAAGSGLTEAIKLLLKAGANPNCPDTHGRMPIELAAVYGTREDVEILFPLTNPIPTVADWSVDGVITYANLERKKLEDDDYVNTKMSDLKQKGNEAFDEQDYEKASVWYTQALEVDPCDATTLLKRCLCWLRMGEGKKAVKDATTCTKHHPKLSEAYHRLGEALMLEKDYEKACAALTHGIELDPESDEMDKLFWRSLLVFLAILKFFQYKNVLETKLITNFSENQHACLAINDSGANPEYNLDEPTMEEKLATLNLLNGGGEGTAGDATQEQPLSVVVPPSADSVHVLLKQALRADDHASLLNCLYNKDHKVIVNSISLLTPADAVKLLKFFILLMQSRGAVLVSLLPWLQSLLSQHMSSIVSQESSLLLLNSLYHLSTCLDYLFSEIDDDGSGEEEGSPPIIYEDKDTDDEESEVDDMETSGEGEDLGGVTDASEHSGGSEVMSD
uniref:Small-subunit processome Utp12 domain-containing protein n=1 Tax=Oryza meridionalis TaxID=40149 RepID=A0A0E0FEQ8_9ORYZ